MSKLLAKSGNTLPSEITEAILRLLPPKSLGRFKSVSKTWKSLISDPQFIKTHLLQNIDHHETSKMVVVSDTESIFSLDVSELLRCLYSDDVPATGNELPFRLDKIWGSCNGLVLAEDRSGTVFIMNPTTRERSEVPISPFALPPDVAFSGLYVFCYDSATDDYKVISILFCKHHPDCTDTFLSVFSLRNNSWKKLPNSPLGHHIREITISSVVINQKLYFSGTESTVVAFSLANEEFSVITLPEAFGFEEVWSLYSLLDHGGRLGAFVDFVNIGEGYELWVREEESWTKVFSVGCNITIDREICPFETLCLVDRVIVLDYNGAVVEYDVDEARCRKVMIDGGSTGFVFVVGTYVETFESPGRIITTV